MRLRAIERIIQESITKVLRVIHRTLSAIGITDHYVAYKMDSPPFGFVITGKRGMLRSGGEGGKTWSDQYPMAILYSTYDWPGELLGEYKPWKITFK